MNSLTIPVITITLMLGLSGRNSATAAEVGFSSDKRVLKASLDRRVEQLFENQGSHAWALGVIKDGRSYAKAYGVLAKDSTQKPDANTLFQIGSISKVFTASLLHILVDKNVVKMDATLKELIGNTIELSAKAETITLRQLATHTAGLPRVPISLLGKMAFRGGLFKHLNDPYSHVNADDIFSYLAAGKGIKPPGNYEYSNYGMGLLGHVLEQVTGESLEQMYKKHLFEPMKMKHTSSELPVAGGVSFAQGHDEKGNPVVPWQFTALAGAGAINSNINDMLAFIKASLEPGSNANQRLIEMRVQQFESGNGLGWVRATPKDIKLGLEGYVWHNGLTGGFASYIAINPDDEIGIVVLSSRASEMKDIGVKLARVLISQSWAD